MEKMIRSRHFLLLAATGTLLLPQVAGHGALGQTATQRTQERPGTTVAYTTEAVATVESIDQQSREVLLRGSGGRLFTVKAGPAVENLARVKTGDRVVVRYVEALAASLAKPGQGGGGTAVEQGGISRHAPEGARPTGTIGNQIRSTVTIDAIDRATYTVTFTGPANAARTVAVKDPDAQRFLDTLKPGERVDLVYTESLAVAVEPMSK
jgi:hypothetical protein